MVLVLVSARILEFGAISKFDRCLMVVSGQI